MSTSPSSGNTTSASSESIDLGSARTGRASSALAISNVGQISALLEEIRSNKSQWAIGDQTGIAYYFINDRLYKQCNVLNRAGVRNKIEVRNQEHFFEKLASLLLEQTTTFVEVQLCGKAMAVLLYCHAKLQPLEPKRRVLLLGKAVLVQGNFNDYYGQPTVVAPGTRVKLYGRTFNIRVSSNQHVIYLRTDDIIKNRVRLLPQPQLATGEVGHATFDATGEDYETTEDDELDDATNEDSEEGDSDTEGSRSEGSRGSRGGSPAAIAGRAARIRPLTPGGRRRQTFAFRRVAITEADIAAVAAANGIANDNDTGPTAAEAAQGPPPLRQLLPGGIRELLFRDAAVQTGNDVANIPEEVQEMDDDNDDARPQRPHSH